MRPALITEFRIGLITGACLLIGTVSGVPKSFGQASAPSIASPSDPRALDLLRRMLTAEDSLRLSGIQVTTVIHEGRPVTSEQRIMRNGNRAMRTEYVSPPRMAGEVIIDNGKNFWHYIPAENRLDTGPSRFERMRDRLKQARKHLDQHSLTAQWSGGEKIAGHYCGIIDVQSPSEHGMRRRRFWIDPENGAQLGIEQYDPNGERRSTTLFKDVAYNPVFDAKAFCAPATPKDVKIVKLEKDASFKSVAEVREHAGFRVFEPGYLPPGYTFQSGGINHFGPRKMASLRYVNGLTTLSLFQTPSEEPNGGEEIKHPRTGVATKRHAGIRLVLVGNIEPAEADKILLSVR